MRAICAKNPETGEWSLLIMHRYKNKVNLAVWDTYSCCKQAMADRQWFNEVFADATKA